LLAKKKRTPIAPVPPPVEPKAGAGAAPTPVTTQQAAPAAPPPPPPTPQVAPEEELESLIGGEETLKNRTATARLFLARAMLATAKQDQQTHDNYYDQLSEFESTELSAFILGQLAEYLIDKSEVAKRRGDEDGRNALLEKADRFSKELLSSFPKSEFVRWRMSGWARLPTPVRTGRSPINGSGTPSRSPPPFTNNAKPSSDRERR
jgi:hypothetical protein